MCIVLDGQHSFTTSQEFPTFYVSGLMRMKKISGIPNLTRILPLFRLLKGFFTPPDDALKSTQLQHLTVF
jgi:hypothetical protein